MNSVNPSKIAATFGAVAAIIAISTGGQSLRAQATRTWVSGVGDDVNPASRTAPCKTFAGAISKTATGGEINCIDSGGFGSVTITKSMTIDGAGTHASILAPLTTGIIINAGATGIVTLRNLSINGATTGITGIRILGAAEVNIENCVIFEFASASGRGIDINPNVGPVNGVRVNVRNSIVRGCTAGAVISRPQAAIKAVVSISGCSLSASLHGLRAEDRSFVTINDTILSGNENSGVTAFSASAGSILNVNDCTISDNGLFGVVTSGAAASIRISNNTIFGHQTGISIGGGPIQSFGNNRITGNGVAGTPTAPILTEQ